MGKVLLVASGKGGTGKTMFSVNMGAALAQRGYTGTDIRSAEFIAPNETVSFLYTILRIHIQILTRYYCIEQY